MSFCSLKHACSCFLKLWLFIAVLQVSPVHAHSDLHERIVALTKQLQITPHDPSLLFKRAELNRQHHDWNAALADYDQVEKLDADFPAVDFGRGRTLYESGQAAEALAALDRYLIGNPKHIRALLTRARARVLLARYQDAIADYDKVIFFSNRPLPEYYIERAESWAALGEKFHHKAIKGLDEGLSTLGPVFTLQYAAIDLEVKSRQYANTLKRIDALPASIKNTSTWQQKRGDILLLAGDAQKAQAAFDFALAKIHKLPETRRKVKAVAELEKQLLTRLKNN